MKAKSQSRPAILDFFLFFLFYREKLTGGQVRVAREDRRSHEKKQKKKKQQQQVRCFRGNIVLRYYGNDSFIHDTGVPEQPLTSIVGYSRFIVDAGSLFPFFQAQHGHKNNSSSTPSKLRWFSPEQNTSLFTSVFTAQEGSGDLPVTGASSVSVS